jgi:hypothetical protein
MDLSDLLLILGSFEGSPNFLELSQNSTFQFTPTSGRDWRGGQSIKQLVAPFVCLKFSSPPYDPQGWVAGSDGDAEACDLQLVANNKAGVSRRHFRIDINPSTFLPRVLCCQLEPIIVRRLEVHREIPEDSKANRL